MNKLRILLVGVGHMGRSWLKHLLSSPDWDIAALVDRSEQALSDAKSSFGIGEIPQFSSLNAALSASVEADAAAVVVSSPYHYELCREALMAGLHIVVEKPFSTNYDHALELTKLAEQDNRLLMVQQNYRYLPVMRALRQEVITGHCGEPFLGTVQFYLRHMGRHYQKTMLHVNNLEMAIHHYDALRFVLGQTPISVFGYESNPAWSWYKQGSSVQALLTFRDDLHVSYTSTFVSPSERTPWEGEWRLECKEATLILGDCGQGFGAYRRVGAECALLALQDNEGMGTPQTLAEFAECIRLEKQPQTSAQDNLESLAVAFAVAQSAKLGRVVELSSFPK